jgi:hypothetical protein
LSLVEAMAPNKKRAASSSSSPAKSKRAATATATSTAKKSVGKKPVTQPLSSLGFSSSKRAAIQIGTKVLLDDRIYVGGKCPAEVKNHWFVYEVVELNENGRSWKVLFKEQVVREGGDKYRVYKEGEKPQVRTFWICFVPFFIFSLHFSSIAVLLRNDKYLDLNFQQIKGGHESWCETNTRVNSRIQAVRQKMELAQMAEVVDVDVDLSDINKLFEEKGQGRHLLEMEFLPITEGPVNYISKRTGKPTKRWTFKHKTTGVKVNRYPTRSGKAFDTGVLSRYLQRLEESDSSVAFARAQHIILLNSKNGTANFKSSAPEQPLLTREDLLKHWVSPFSFFIFKSTSDICSLCFSLHFKGPCNIVLHRIKLRNGVSPRHTCHSFLQTASAITCPSTQDCVHAHHTIVGESCIPGVP